MYFCFICKTIQKFNIYTLNQGWNCKLYLTPPSPPAPLPKPLIGHFYTYVMKDDYHILLFFVLVHLFRLIWWLLIYTPFPLALHIYTLLDLILHLKPQCQHGYVQERGTCWCLYVPQGTIPSVKRVFLFWPLYWTYGSHYFPRDKHFFEHPDLSSHCAAQFNTLLYTSQNKTYGSWCACVWTRSSPNYPHASE